MRFAKGHGTGNDFVILPDPDGRLDLSPQAVALICDRHAGLGADGVLRLVRCAAAGPAAEPWATRAAAQGAQWFMDYRNADGSVAEMCGNGVRVFARYLLESGLAAGPELAVGTRSGVRVVRAEGDGWFSAEMGPAKVTGTGSARLGEASYAGLGVSVGNPHLVCLLDFPVAAADLTRPPGLDPGQFPDGANVEVVQVTGDHQAEMRVYERGSGVTLSCGTGAVAAAVGAAVAAGEWQAGPEQTWAVRVPGGRLAVTPSAVASRLAGPAVIVAAGELDDTWLREATATRTGDGRAAVSAGGAAGPGQAPVTVSGID
jgi:diaminopimelate epimerase